MKKQVKQWWNSRQIKEKEQTISTIRETIIFNLLNELTVIESVNLYKEVNNIYVAKLKERLTIINLEKECLDEFLSV